MEKKYLKWYNMVGYGSGDIAGNVVYALLTSFVMIYLTNTVGLNSGIVGTLIAVSKLFDGITDVFFGSMIDKTKSKMGKARPWQGDMNAVIASCSEYTYLTKKKRVDGTMYSCTSLGVKLGGGLGTALAGWLLAFSGFDGMAAVQPQSCINMIYFMYLWIPFIIDFVIMLLLSGLKVEEANERLKQEFRK